MPNYRKKRLKPATPNEFKRWLAKCQNQFERALITTLYYWGIRISEAINLHHTDLYFDEVKVYLKINRLKRSKQTDDLPVNFNSPGMDALMNLHIHAERENRLIFPINRIKAWKICNRLGTYPHFFRLSRFTHIGDKYGLVALMNWGGITADTANSYIGKSDLRKMEIT